MNPEDPATATVRRLVQTSREAGTPEAAAAREVLTSHLTGLGYRVREQPFAFSPAGLNAFPLFGAGLGWLGLLELPLLAVPAVPGWAALAVLLPGLAGLALLAAGIGLGWTALGQPLREDANLIATRSGGRIRHWIIAHADSKAQYQSMAGRLVAVWLVLLTVVGALGAAVARLWRPLEIPVLVGVAALGLAAGALANRGRLHGRSPGARDNGTGVAALLAAAARIQDPSVGFLITGAEEFGLVGARYFLQTMKAELPGSVFLNVDTVDERGPWRVVRHGSAAKQLARSLADRLPVGPGVRRHRLPPGIFVDSLPFARAGLPALTLARLDWQTLRRLHTPRDTAEDLAFTSALAAGAALAQLLTAAPAAD